MITIKLPIQNKIDIINLQRQQSILTRFSYKRLKEGKSEKEIYQLWKPLKNLSDMDSWYVSSSIQKAKSYIKDNDSIVIFGGKNNLKKLKESKITKEEWRQKRLMPLYFVGETNQYGNRKFNLDIISNNQVIFKPKKGIKIVIQLPKLNKNYKKFLYALENQKPAYSVSMTNEWISFSFEENIIKEKYEAIGSRLMSIDLNPNYIGYSVFENEKMLDRGIISIKQINDEQNDLPEFKKYYNNKRKHEIFEISKYLTNLAKHFKCEYFCLEQLSIKSKNNKKGKNYNRLINNQWNRNDLINNLKKRCNIQGIKIIEIDPQYSSIIGNLMYCNLNLPDPILASIELARRARLYIGKFIKKNINPPQIILPDWRKAKKILKESTEERFKNLQVSGWLELFEWIKNSEVKYRVSLEDCSFEVFRLRSSKSKVQKFDFDDYKCLVTR